MRAPTRGTPPALQAPLPETPGECCGLNIKVSEIPRQGSRIGLVAVVAHVVAFLVGNVVSTEQLTAAHLSWVEVLWTCEHLAAYILIHATCTCTTHAAVFSRQPRTHGRRMGDHYCDSDGTFLAYGFRCRGSPAQPRFIHSTPTSVPCWVQL